MSVTDTKDDVIASPRCTFMPSEQSAVREFIDKCLWQTNYKNVYVKTRAECEILLAEMIEITKAEIAAEKERLKAGQTA